MPRFTKRLGAYHYWRRRRKNKFRESSKKMNLQRLVFAGYISNMEPYYQNASIICLTSNFEGWPLCLTEALSYGVIPISFNCSEE